MRSFPRPTTLGMAALAAVAAVTVAAPDRTLAEVANVITFAVPPEGSSGYLMVSAFGKVVHSVPAPPSQLVLLVQLAPAVLL